MKKILIMINNVVYNKGSEALVRGISKICREFVKDSKITLVSSEENFSESVNIEYIDCYISKLDYTSKSIKRYVVAVLKRLKLFNICNKVKYSNLMKIANEQDLIIVVGADNYDITYKMQEELNGFNSYLKKNTKAKLILYDCSLDERDITETLKDDLNNFDAITVRETISEENVKKLKHSIKVCLCSDPAFVMESEKVKLPIIFNSSKVIGINVSNLITNTKYGSNSEKILNAYKNMIKYILDTTEMGILLIPHVMNNADLSTLSVLYDEFNGNERVYLMKNEQLNAKQLKYIISNCEMFVGARTHATIAAYSSMVPTLVLGYSVKSRGIAKDIFGTYENYVLPVAELKSDNYLIDGFKWLSKNKNEFRKQLTQIMPEYKKSAKNVGKLINELLEGK